MSFLLDTNVVSEMRRGRHPGVAAWAASVDQTDLHLSVLSVGEVRKGVERLGSRDPAQAEVFARWLEELRVRYADRILPIDDRVADRWGHLAVERDRPIIDSLIAATALVHGLTVVTRNVADFADCGVVMLNPWER